MLINAELNVLFLPTTAQRLDAPPDFDNFLFFD